MGVLLPMVQAMEQIIIIIRCVYYNNSYCIIMECCYESDVIHDYVVNFIRIVWADL